MENQVFKSTVTYVLTIYMASYGYIGVYDHDHNMHFMYMSGFTLTTVVDKNR